MKRRDITRQGVSEKDESGSRERISGIGSHLSVNQGRIGGISHTAPPFPRLSRWTGREAGQGTKGGLIVYYMFDVERFPALFFNSNLLATTCLIRPPHRLCLSHRTRTTVSQRLVVFAGFAGCGGIFLGPRQFMWKREDLRNTWSNQTPHLESATREVRYESNLTYIYLCALFFCSWLFLSTVLFSFSRYGFANR